ncbi:UDP-N-acetylmuramate dehydrogenase [Myxococcota bacterium]|nr:UDP-N-acetylmuramate dehydrogenase [Myxococcota bacterium]
MTEAPRQDRGGTSADRDAASSWRDALARALGDRVTFDEPLAPKVAFRIGGPADAFARPMNGDQLAAVLRVARDHRVPVTVLGTGSNVLVSDLGIRGITVRLTGELADVHVVRTEADHVEIDAGAGALNAPLVALAFKMGAVGLEFLATIPGTFGGALIMNAGAHGGEIKPFITHVGLIDSNLSPVVRAGTDCGFAYRSSGFAPGELLTGARLVVPKGDVAHAKAHLAEMRAARRRTQPNEHPNAGSIFKNPPGNYAGRLIEAAGLKGRRIGGAEISDRHANFIVNTGGALAREVVALARIAQVTVKDHFGIDLEWEVKWLGDRRGFENDPTSDPM